MPFWKQKLCLYLFAFWNSNPHTVVIMKVNIRFIYHPDGLVSWLLVSCQLLVFLSSSKLAQALAQLFFLQQCCTKDSTVYRAIKTENSHVHSVVSLGLDVQGFAECRSFGSSGQLEGVVALTARRSRLHPGTRYLARGLNSCFSTGEENYH